MGTEPSIAERLSDDMKQAMRAKETVRLGAIRRARAALKNAEIEAGGPLDDAAAEKVLRKLARQHEESIEQFSAGGRDELVAKEREELAAIEAYLPAQMEESEIEVVVAEVIAAEGATGPGDLGVVMKASMARLGGAADGGAVNAVVRRLLGS